jgi:enamine deaminase RidA (YjgF/YER057c/UK114 family)
MMTIGERLRERKLTLPEPGAARGNHAHARRCGDLVFLSGKGPPEAGAKGKLGAGVTAEEGYRYARGVGLVLIAALKEALDGDLDRVEAVAKVLGFVNAAGDFEDHPTGVNGCSDLLVEVFGERGRHARSAVGVASLPGGIPVEIEAIVAVK